MGDDRRRLWSIVTDEIGLRTRQVSSYHLAFVHNALGASGDALSCLERAFEERDPKMVFLDVEPKWPNLRVEPRFVRPRKRMKFPG